VTYRIRWELTAWRAWRKLDARLGLQLLHAVTDLAANPTPAASTALVGAGEFRRLRVGDYRVIYSIHVDTVTIHEVGHRREIYD